MDNDNHIKKLTEIAYLYYIDGMSQSQIAKEFSISRSMVSVMLTEAKAKGIVKIEIKDFDLYCFDLQRDLERIFQLKKAIVVPTLSKSEESELRQLSTAAANFLNQILDNDMTIGVSWGRTMHAVAKRIQSVNKKDLLITPLVGGAGNEMNYLHSNVIADLIAKKLNGTSLCLYAPVFVSSREVRDALFDDKIIKGVIDKGESADIALVGIGTIKNSTMIDEGSLHIEDREELLVHGAVGDINSWFFDKNGQYIDALITEKTIAINRKKLSKIPYIIAVAGGLKKIEAIHAALKGKLMNVLVTDESVARTILKEYRNS
ncbi:MAG: sugar-binding transcriptional regulator [Bacillota bacterium]|nr:sugar-binding transcriptional regulator [Bacillota bacterium]